MGHFKQKHLYLFYLENVYNIMIHRYTCHSRKNVFKIYTQVQNITLILLIIISVKTIIYLISGKRNNEIEKC